jgi:nuclear pore complex protein Nup155
MVATHDEVMLCALARQKGKLYVVATRYILPTDNNPIVSICGLPDGRIFMGGFDGSLFEFVYENVVSANLPAKTQEQKLEEFYDGNVNEFDVVSNGGSSNFIKKGKRALSAFLGSSDRPQKCRKLNHSVKGFSAIASVIVPDWLLKVPITLFGPSNYGPMEKIIYDSERSFLYTLSSRGAICVYDVRKKNLSLQASIDCVSAARQYLSSVAKGHMYSSSSSIEFLGGGASAHAGVGGMDGARSILRLADTEVKGNILTPSSIHILHRRESSRLTLLAVTASGIRYYLTALSLTVKQETLNLADRIVLCHIRAPPPIDTSLGSLKESFDDRDVSGGLIPELLPGMSVDASYYFNGHLLLALRKPQRSTEVMDDTVGSLIVGTTPDHVARKVIHVENKTVRELPGGIAEAVSLPASQLPGGRIIDVVGLGSSCDPAMMHLILHSQTPSDSELGVGLVPSFLPRSETQSIDQKQKASTGSSDVVRSVSLVKANAPKLSKSSIALQVFTNFLLSRPLGYGLSFQSTLPVHSTVQEQRYRVSNRYGSEGFSLTACEIEKTNDRTRRSGQSMSSRLSRWLLCPDVVALKETSLAHIIPSTRTVAISVGGIHFFKRNSILTRLAETLAIAGPNISRDYRVIEFCNNFGATKFCTMCFTLVIGCGPAKGSSDTAAGLRTRALKAAFGCGGEPRLIAKAVIGELANNVILEDVSSDKFVPRGYEFSPSFLSQALISLAARLLRPIWYKPVVVVTEGRRIKVTGEKTKKLPAKVELLLEDSVLEEVRAPLYALMQLMKKHFQRAISEVPGISPEDSNKMEIDESSVVTGSMRFHGNLRRQNNSTDVLTMEEAIATARRIEERNLHVLYRLISRSVQLLDLISLLKRAQYMPDLPEVEWGLLHGLTTSQLVECRDSQDRIETLLNSLVCTTHGGDHFPPSADSDDIARSLSSQCYLYFSTATSLSYYGFRAANEALHAPPMSAKRVTFSKQTTDIFKKAASFWSSANLITGRFMHCGEAKSYDEMADLALRHHSPLAKAASALAMIGEYVAIVDICNITAGNFHAENGGKIISTNENIGFSWERNLYHRVVKDLNTTDESSSSGSDAIVVAALVTPKDAIATCHAIILFFLQSLLKSEATEDSKNRMISACAASSDLEFRVAFFEFLVRTKNEHLLIKIDSPAVENWLDSNKDPNLKWQYYVLQRKNKEAGELMWNLATASDNTSLEERILYLERSQTSFNSAASSDSVESPNGKQTRLELENKRIRASEYLDVARLQERTLKAVRSLVLESDLEDEKLLKLETSLIDVSDLYNDYAAKLELHEVCLHILRSCRYNDMVTIELLWQRMICQEIMPCSTKSQATYDLLCSLLGGDKGTVELLPFDGKTASHPIFETGFWIDRLKSGLIPLGTELYGKGYEYIIPIDFLVTTLEGESIFHPLLRIDNANNNFRTSSVM